MGEYVGKSDKIKYDMSHLFFLSITVFADCLYSKCASYITNAD